jgi:hypothetical protein
MLETARADEDLGWLLLTVGEDRQHGGNDGYDDAPDAYYSWDSTVPNHGALAKGDRIALWDKVELLGISIIQDIEVRDDEKLLRKCPECGLAGIKARKTLEPRYKCYKCKQPFEVPTSQVERVTWYRARYDANWTDLAGAIQGKRLRELCDSPGSQLSLRRLRWSALLRELDQTEDPQQHEHWESEKAGFLPGGHQYIRVRARLGQREFRKHLLSQCGRVCAITGPAPDSVLEAAHLYSFAGLGVHHEHGGLMLRRDIHRLFDRGDICINPGGLTIDLRPSLSAYAVYEELQGKPLHLKITNGGQLEWSAKHWKQHRADNATQAGS